MNREERLRLTSTLDSVPVARAFTRRTVARWGQDRRAEDIVLAVSELVSNAVVHARTDVTLTLKLQESGAVRVEVRDHDGSGIPVVIGMPPTAGLPGDRLDNEAMSGRGLLVVSAVADAWGAEPSTAGKTVWAEFGDSASAPVAAGAGGAAGGGGAGDAPGGNGAGRKGAGGNGTGRASRPLPMRPAPSRVHSALRYVRLIGVPVRLVMASETNMEDILREFEIVSRSSTMAQMGMPPDLLDLIDRFNARYGALRVAMHNSAVAAAERNQRLLDISTAIAPGPPDELWQLLAVLEQAAAFSLEGLLLAMPPDDEVVAFRRWLASEIDRQLAGVAPIACPFPTTAAGPSTPARPVRADWLLAERHARLEAEQLAARLATLQDLTGRLSAAVTAAEVGEVVLGPALDELGAATGSLCLLEPDGVTVRIAQSAGYQGEVTDFWATFAVSADLPASEVIRTGEMVLLHDASELVQRYPAFLDTPVVGDRSMACLPLRVGGGPVIGALALGWSDRHDFDLPDLGFLQSLAGQAAQALERASLHDAVAAARDRMAFIAHATEALNASLDLDATLTAVVELAVPRLGDWCSVHLLDGEPRLVAVAHRDDRRRELARSLHERWPVQLNGSAIGAAMIGGELTVVQPLPREALVAAARDPEHLAVMEQLGMGAIMVVPIMAGGVPVGALSIANEPGRPVTDDDRALAVDLAARTGSAVANARLHAAHVHAAQALQASLLADRLPEVPGLQLAAAYRPSGAVLDVGGDFYDTFMVDDRLWMVVGDVCGKGVEAAALTGVLRHSIRALAHAGSPPPAVFADVNRLLVDAAADSGADPRFCTAVVAVVSPAARRDRADGRGRRIEVWSAGHPESALRRTGKGTEFVGASGDLLGVHNALALIPATVELAPGDLLVLHTDGVTERRTGGRFFGPDGLARTLDALPAGSGAVDAVDAVVVAVTGFAPVPAADDLAILAVSVTA